MEMVIWLLFAVFSAALASSKNRSGLGWFLIGLLFGPFGLLVAFFPKIDSEQHGDSASSAEKEAFEEQWSTLVRYDETVKDCVKQLEDYGSGAVAELKKAYRAVSDKGQLSKITERIISDLRDGDDEGKLMDKYGIIAENSKYVYQGYSYDRLEDAVNYAKLGK